MTISLRPAEPADDAFLCDLYASSREAELALVDWSDDHKAAFVRQQFVAQSRHYREHYSGATHDVIVVDDEPAGRIYVDRWPSEIRVVDISLLPGYRGKGIGSRLLRDVQVEGAASDRSVTIHVERFNPAWRLYTRLGFVPADDNEPVYVLMRWTPDSAPEENRSKESPHIRSKSPVPADTH
jgi:GNAT superfamily N-acetyltransferase